MNTVPLILAPEFVKTQLDLTDEADQPLELESHEIISDPYFDTDEFTRLPSTFRSEGWFSTQLEETLNSRGIRVNRSARRTILGQKLKGLARLQQEIHMDMKKNPKKDPIFPPSVRLTGYDEDFDDEDTDPRQLFLLNQELPPETDADKDDTEESPAPVQKKIRGRKPKMGSPAWIRRNGPVVVAAV